MPTFIARKKCIAPGRECRLLEENEQIELPEGTKEAPGILELVKAKPEAEDADGLEVGTNDPPKPRGGRRPRTEAETKTE